MSSENDEKIIDLELFSERMVSVRKSLGKTQKAMSELLGTTLRAYQFYEMKRSVPNAETLVRMAKATGRSIDWVLRGVGPEMTAEKGWAADLDGIERQVVEALLEAIREAPVAKRHELIGGVYSLIGKAKGEVSP